MIQTNTSYNLQQNNVIIFLVCQVFFMRGSEKLPHALLITQISKENYADFLDFPMYFKSV